MAKKAAKKAAKKKPAEKKSAGKQGKSSTKQAADFGTAVALHDIAAALAEIKNLLQQLLRQQGQPPRRAPLPAWEPPLTPRSPLPPYEPLNPCSPSPVTWKCDEVPLETKGLPPGLMFNGAHTDTKALSKAEY